MTPSEEIAAIRAQEDRLQFTSFTNADAVELGLIILDLARERSLPVAIDVCRGDHQLFHVALQGTTPDNGAWVRRKSNTAQLKHASSLRVGLELAQEGTSLEAHQGLPTIDYASHGGSFPIRMTNVGVVGAVTVSGLPQRDDHALVVEGIELFLAARDAEM